MEELNTQVLVNTISNDYLSLCRYEEGPRK